MTLAPKPSSSYRYTELNSIGFGSKNPYLVSCPAGRVSGFGAVVHFAVIVDVHGHLRDAGLLTVHRATHTHGLKSRANLLLFKSFI